MEIILHNKDNLEIILDTSLPFEVTPSLSGTTPWALTGKCRIPNYEYTDPQDPLQEYNNPSKIIRRLTLQESPEEVQKIIETAIFNKSFENHLL